MYFYIRIAALILNALALSNSFAMMKQEKMLREENQLLERKVVALIKRKAHILEPFL